MIKNLNKIAIRINIDPIDTENHSARVENVVKVLSNIVCSYNKYLEIELTKDEQFKELFSQNNKLLDKLKKDLGLLIVDLNYSSFEAALAPNIVDDQINVFNLDADKWRKEAYTYYKDQIIMGNYNSPQYIKSISEKYSVNEREKIYKPIFTSIGDGREYSLHIKDNQNHSRVIRTIQKPDASNINYYISKVKAKQPKIEYETVQYVVKVEKSEEELNFKKQKVKEVLYTKKLDHETYPFEPNRVVYNDTIIHLKENLMCEVNYEDNVYVISNEKFDIFVFGNTRDEAELEFYFYFYSLYKNYFLEINENLSEKAIELKQRLKSIISYIQNETPQA